MALRTYSLRLPIPGTPAPMGTAIQEETLFQIDFCRLLLVVYCLLLVAYCLLLVTCYLLLKVVSQKQPWPGTKYGHCWLP
jgi:hypothetical protein